MYIYILVAFLQMQPYPVAAFLHTFDSKKACLDTLEEYKPTVPKEHQDDVMCIAVLNPKFVRDT